MSGVLKLSHLFSGTARKSETTQALLQMAVYVANTFYLTSNSIVPITRDKDVVHDDLRDRNLIIVGETSFALPYLEKTALNIGDDHSISLGKIDLLHKIHEPLKTSLRVFHLSGTGFM